MKVLLVSLIGVLIAGCGQNYSFQPSQKNNSNNIIPPPTPEAPSTTGNSVFNLQSTEVNFTQDVFAQNIMSAQFQIVDDFGFTINNLNKNQIVVKENGTPVSQFNLDLQNNNGNKTADIVVVLDVTTSMDPYIDELKRKIGRFVDALSRTNVKARLCLVTFGESTEDMCTRFIEDNPNTGKNENLDDFVNKVSSIITHGGGTQMNENQLRAMIDAAQKTPWGNQAQRVSILITDASFHYAPDNIGEGVNVPTYENTLSTIQNTQMQSFVIAFPSAGYDRPLKGQLSMPRATGGDFYNLGDVVGGLTNMEEIFKSIAAKISQGFVINYVVDHNPNLNPELTLGQRTVTIEITDPLLKGTIKITNISSSLPQGRPKYKNKFKVSDKKIDKASIKVWINNNPVNSNVAVSDEDIEFSQSPDPGSQIKATFLLSNLKENLSYQPSEIKLSFVPKSVEVIANGIKLKSDEFSFSVVGQKLNLELSEKVFESASDKFEIKKRGKLELNYIIK